MRVVLRTLLAALVGYLLASAAMSAGNSLTAQLFRLLPGTLPTTGHLIANVAISFSASVLSGYVCCRLAPAAGRLFAAALLILLFLGAAVVLWRMSPAAHQPPGYLPLVSLLDVVGLWTGAMLERATKWS